MARVQQHIDKFAPTELEVVATCAYEQNADPTTATHPIQLAHGGTR